MKQLVAVAILGYATSCQIADDDAVDFEMDIDFHGDLDEGQAGTPTEGVVGDYLQTECSTAVVAPLSRQIAEEILCMVPGAFVRLDPGDGIRFRSAAVLPYMDADAAVGLRRAGADVPITLNSGYRTVAQQLLLHEWRLRGRCGIAAAAAPGRSNHESGRAIDVSTTRRQRAALRSNGWTDPVARDPVHFEFREAPDQRGLDIHAFQRLWNRNHPEDPLDEDGEWTQGTRARMLQTPVRGFDAGPMCEAGGSALEEEGMCFEDGDGVDACCVGAGQDGVCIDTRVSRCRGAVYEGACPGSSDVRCCVP